MSWAELSVPAGAVTATWTTSGRTFVTHKISSGVCCPVGGSSSRAEDSDMVTAHSVGASASPGVARSVCNSGECRGPRADDRCAVVVGYNLTAQCTEVHQVHRMDGQIWRLWSGSTRPAGRACLEATLGTCAARLQSGGLPPARAKYHQ